MKRGTALCALVAAVTLSACAYTPTRATHPAALDGGALGLAGAPAPAVTERWWQAFGDARLDELVAAATRDNPTLAEALARLQRASSDALAAASAGGVQVEASGEVLRERFSDRYIIPPPYGGASFWDGQAQLGLAYDLDFWGRQRAVIRAAERYTRAGELDVRAAALALQGAVVTAYIELDLRHAVADIAREAEDTRGQIAALTRRRVAAGLDTGIDRRAADAALPESRADRDQALAAIDLTVHRLAELAGRGAPAYTNIGRPKLAYDAAIPLPSVLPGDLLLRRPDLQAALARVAAAAAAEDAARLAAYPEINLRAFAGFAALTLADLLSAPARTYGLGPAVRLPIFDAGLLRARFRGAGADLEVAVARYNATVLGAVREVADGISTVDARGRGLRDADQRLTLLIQARQLAEERYRAGLTTRLTVLEADSRVLAARRALVAARALEAEARVGLVVVLGGSTEPVPPSPAVSARAMP